MVDRLIERWRGIDRWPKATAMVMSYETLADGRIDETPPDAKITFYYLDTAKSLQSGELIVDSFTPLYSLRANDTFEVQFDPQAPSTFYSTEAANLFTGIRSGVWVSVSAFIVIFLATLLFSKK